MISYGVAGLGSGVGTTHFSILLAHYLSDGLRRRCALMESGESEDILRLRQMGRWEKSGSLLHILSPAPSDALSRCREAGFAAVVMDLGRYEKAKREAFCRCDRKLMVCSVTDWQLEELADCWSRKELLPGTELLAAFGSERARKMTEKLWGLKIRRIPWTPGADRIDGAALRWFAGFII